MLNLPRHHHPFNPRFFEYGKGAVYLSEFKRVVAIDESRKALVGDSLERNRDDALTLFLGLARE